MAVVPQVPGTSGHLTAGLPGVGGRIRIRPEDFVVEELPLYPASGTGEHLLVDIEKRGLTTHALIRELARTLRVPAAAIGRAGLKDAGAVTRQRLSIPAEAAPELEGLRLEGVRILSAERHARKLRIGHLAGNRFRIRVRHLELPAEEAELRGRAVLDVLTRRGVPNAFGAQRFGARGDTWKVGRALLRDDPDEALALVLGRPEPHETPRIREARSLYDQGRHAEAAAAWPGGFGGARRAAWARARGASTRKALQALGRSMLRFYVSAYQSLAFNALLERRLDEVDALRAGDLAWLHDRGAVFSVEDPAAEVERLRAFALSPSGPLHGPRMTRARGRPGELENEALAALGGRPEDFSGPRARRLGGRRPLRVPLGDSAASLGSDDLGAFLELRFVLPPGAYATCVVREVSKAG